MRNLLVDTSAWHALIDRDDPHHHPVAEVMRQRRASPTNFVFQETVTLLRYRLGWEPAHRWGEALRSRNLARLVSVSSADEDAAWSVFSRYHDHRFSFVDCTSFAAMRRLKIEAAITVDDDFRAFGLASLP